MKFAHQIDIPSGMKTAVFLLGEGVFQEIPALWNEFFPGKTPWIIADENTWRAAGEAVSVAFQKGNIQEEKAKIFPGTPRLMPKRGIADELAVDLYGGTIPVAVGNGVINDLCKCAAGLAGVPYLCIPTAASVDGYTTAGATILDHGVKANFKCPPPLAIVAETGVLERAPKSMLACGYGDLFSKITAGAEWLLADALGIEPIDPAVWKLVQEPLRDNLSDPADVQRIFRGLANTGYSMQLYHDSRPAAGSEHLFSLIWDMEQLNVNGREIPHGIQVGVATLAVVKLCEFIIHTPVEKARATAKPFVSKKERISEIDRLLSKGCYGGAKDIALEKFLEGAAAVERRERIFQKWESFQSLLKKQLYPSAEVENMLKQAGAVPDYREIGLTQDDYLDTPRRAQLIRKRYMVLDVLYESGLLDSAVGTLEV